MIDNRFGINYSLLNVYQLFLGLQNELPMELWIRCGIHFASKILFYG